MGSTFYYIKIHDLVSLNIEVLDCFFFSFLFFSFWYFPIMKIPVLYSINAKVVLVLTDEFRTFHDMGFFKA